VEVAGSLGVGIREVMEVGDSGSGIGAAVRAVEQSGHQGQEMSTSPIDLANFDHDLNSIMLRWLQYLLSFRGCYLLGTYVDIIFE